MADAVPEGIASRVARMVAASGLAAPDERALGAWIALVAAWNTRIDLTAARTEDELCDLMLADALVLAAKIPEGARVVDVGSGAGAPGLPLAIARPDLTVTLVEPLQKRVAFLRTAVGSVMAGRKMPVVVRGRGEDLAAKGQRFDAAISRATLAPGLWLALGARLAPEVWILLAREEPPASTDMTLAEDMRYRWPLTGADRRAVRFAAARDAG